MLWSEDSPDLFAMMEKGRMYIFRCTAQVWTLLLHLLGLRPTSTYACVAMCPDFQKVVHPMVYGNDCDRS